ncbi:MAG TPA: efflux RND transporter periplasmic adaptor subunit [Anaerolineales bacterium]|nr:efflux RND transporter periplasmic adaptor subunit [Anaerolineales bacterium]
MKIPKFIHALPRRALLVILAVILIAGYYGVRALTATAKGQLEASGTIETVSVDISPEISGKVKEVLVAEGDSVKAGDPILVLDDALIKEQRKVAAAAVDSANAASQSAANALSIAKAQYQQALEAALAQGRKARLADWFSKDQQQFDQPNWYFSRTEQIAAVQAEIDAAQKALEDAQVQLGKVGATSDQAAFVAAEQRVLSARVAYLVAKDVNERGQNSNDAKSPQGRYNKTHCGSNQGYEIATQKLVNVIYHCTGDEQLSEVSQKMFDDARTELDAAQRAYDELVSTQAADAVLQARAAVQVAQERYYAALDRLSALQTSDQAPAVTAAQGAVDQAEAAVDQSHKAVAQAQANLDLLDAQMAKLTVYAPLDGVILSRNIEPGEVVQPGAVALSVGDLTQLTITVYVPEDRYGEIHLAQEARVHVDSFPEETFTAQVVHISDQAEFTPRNVQTAEGRSATVYAIKLTVTDAQGRLKPGMPADVTFVTQ